MDLSVDYLGLKLSSPLMPGASPMSDNLDTVKRLEDAGASAIVLRSLFEEQFQKEERTRELVGSLGQSFSEVQSFFPEMTKSILGPDQYLSHIQAVKKAVKIPVIASLNGVTVGGWMKHAKLIEKAGADALEVNFYYVPTSSKETAADVETRLLGLINDMRSQVGIPLAVKLSPFYSAMANLAENISSAGADGLILFNRFYQPDIDIEKLEVDTKLHLSHSDELLLRLRWLAILHGRTDISLAASGGVHTSVDAIKALMAGANAVQMVSALLVRGPHYLKTIREEMAEWMDKHEYESVAQLCGSMSHQKCPNPSAFERANYARILLGWKA